MTLEGDTSSLQLFLRRTNTSGLRLCEDGSRHDVEADVVLSAEDMIHGTHRLHLGSMSQHLTAIDVTDSVETFDHRPLTINL